jgi:hypothetical protein
MTTIHNVIAVRAEHRDNPHWDVVDYRQKPISA